MKRVLFFTLLTLSIKSYSQTVLFSEDFNSGASKYFNLNAVDFYCAGQNSKNQWAVNNYYTGGTGIGTTDCTNLPGGGTVSEEFNIANTPVETSTINGYPNSNYLHVLDKTSSQIGVYCASFIAGDDLCVPADSIITVMDTSINSQGFDYVEISFWWVCYGSNYSYGKLCYSTDGGNNWAELIKTYNKSAAWQKEEVYLPAFGNQNNLRFGFLWINKVIPSGETIYDPSFAIDDIKIIALSPPSITIDSISTTSLCAGSQIKISFDTTGGFLTGNTFLAQLSDSLGSFANSVSIGTHTGNPIYATIPQAANTGTHYRIRVVSSYPKVISADNGYDLTIYEKPEIVSCSDIVNNFCDTIPQVFMIDAKGGTAPYHITWSFLGAGIRNPKDSVVINSFPFAADTAFFTTGGFASYTLKIRDANSCSTFCENGITMKACFPADIDNPSIENGFIIFPNPSNKEITIITQGPEAIKEVTITNIIGQLVSTRAISNSNNKTMEVELPGGSGLYFIHLKTERNEYVRKVIKNAEL